LAAIIGTLKPTTIKAKLRDNTDWAIRHRVFGVPTFVIDDEIFWSHDTFQMALDFMCDPAAFHAPEMQAIECCRSASCAVRHRVHLA
jgi:DSBA-like thioredoxin domain